METKKLFAAILSLGLLVPSVQPVKAENDSNNAETEQAKRDTQTSDDTCTKNPEYASKKKAFEDAKAEVELAQNEKTTADGEKAKAQSAFIEAESDAQKKADTLSKAQLNLEEAQKKVDDAKQRLEEATEKQETAKTELEALNTKLVSLKEELEEAEKKKTEAEEVQAEAKKADDEAQKVLEDAQKALDNASVYYKVVYGTDESLYPFISDVNQSLDLKPAEAQDKQVTYKVYENKGDTSETYDNYASQIRNTGIITPILQTWYWINNGGFSWGTTQKPDDMSNVTVEISTVEGTYYIVAEWEGGAKQYIVDIRDYKSEYIYQTVYQKNEEIIASLNLDGMSDKEKITAITKYIAENYKYDAHYSSAYSMYQNGGGDCWASTDAIKRLANQIGFEAWTHDARYEGGSGSGHRNAIVKSSDGKYYECEAGYAQYDSDGKRPFSVYELSVYDIASSTKTLNRVNAPDITEVVVPEGVVTIGEISNSNGVFSAFYGIEKPNTITIPSTVSKITSSNFTGSANSADWIVDKNNKTFMTNDHGDILSKDGTELYHANPKTTVLEVPSTVKTIREYGIYGWNSQTQQIIFDEGVETLEQGAIYNTSVKKIIFPSTLKYVDKYALFNHAYKSTFIFKSMNTEFDSEALNAKSQLFKSEDTIIAPKGSTAEAAATACGAQFVELTDDTDLSQPETVEKPKTETKPEIVNKTDEETQAEVVKAQEAYDEAKQKADVTAKDLEKSDTELENAQSEFDAKTTEIEETTDKIETTKVDLSKAEKEKEEAQKDCNTLNTDAEQKAVSAAESEKLAADKVLEEKKNEFSAKESIAAEAQTKLENAESNYVIAQNALNAVGHAWKETIVKEPTCTEEGLKTYACENCGETKQETLPALGHDYAGEWTVDKEATYYEDGSKSRHCSRCDSQIDVTVIPRLSFVDVNETTDHYDDILWLATNKVTAGWDIENGQKEFRPYVDVARCDMAAFIRRLAVSNNWLDAATWTPDEEDWNTFTDIDKNSPHAEDVLWLAHTGISEGWTEEDGTKTFRPLVTVARCDMAAFLQRLASKQGLSDASAWEPGEADWTFADIDADSPHAEEVLWLAHSGVSKGWSEADGTTTFRPLTKVARCDMAAFLRRMVG